MLTIGLSIILLTTALVFAELALRKRDAQLIIAALATASFPILMTWWLLQGSETACLNAFLPHIGVSGGIVSPLGVLWFWRRYRTI